MKIRAAVLAREGAELEVTELDLEPPRAGEVLVRLHASGVCHSDLNAIDGTLRPAPRPCSGTRAPAWWRRSGTASRDRGGRARRALVGACLRPLLRVPRRAAAPVRHGLAADGP